MKRLIIALASLLVIGMACNTSQADFRCRGRRIIAPVFHHAPCHEVIHHAAVIPTVATVVTVPQPTFVFQSLQGFPGLPPSAYAPQQQFQPPAAFQAPQMQQPCPQQPLNLTDAQLDRIATLLHAKLTGAAVTQNTLTMNAPPVLGDEPVQGQQPLQMSAAIVNDIGVKCSSCHMEGTKTSGGLALFDKDRNFNPTKGGIAYATPERIYQRSAEGSMPPNAQTNPASRLNAETIAFLKTATGQ